MYERIGMDLNDYAGAKDFRIGCHCMSKWLQEKQQKADFGGPKREAQRTENG